MNVDEERRELAREPVTAVAASSGETVGPETRRRDPCGEGFVEAAQELVRRLRQRDEEFTRLMQITERVNYGVVLEEILDFTYREMRQVIPYNRIGFSLINPEKGTVIARWAKSDRKMLIAPGYQAPLAGSTLQQIIETGRPRIINDLQVYLAAKPSSDSTARIVREGMRSSLTCPLIVQGRPVGFIFFSSEQKDAYSNVHVAFFQQIAGQLAATVEKGQLYTRLAEQKAVIEEQNRAMTRDLTMARTVQRALIPAEAPQVKGLEIAFEYEPAIEVGGDILDIITLKDNRLLLFVGDAMGHGVKAALVMSVVKTALRSAIQLNGSPGRVLANLNKLLVGTFKGEFVTAACCVVDPSTGHAEVALAGHPPPLHLGSDREEVEERGTAEVPLGVVGDTVYPDRRFELARGDVLFLYTDGLIEASANGGEMYGPDRLREALRRYGRSGARRLLDDVKRDLQTHCGQEAKADDLSILIVKAEP